MRIPALLILVSSLLPLQAVAQQKPGAPAPFIVEKTYWIKPGKELQFIALFEKNRVPQLRAKAKDGDVLWMRLSRPQFNAVNEQWDLRITIAWRNAESAIERISQANTQLTRDTQRVALEQQIMEELILERTDVPVEEWVMKDSGT